MRTMVMALVVVGLLAASSHGVLYFKLTADGPITGQIDYAGSTFDKVGLTPGATTTIRLWGMGTSAGVFAFGGSVVAGATDPVLLTSNPDPLVFSPAFMPTGLFTPKPGTPGPNGGRNNFGSQQTDWGNPDSSLGRSAYIELCHYTVTASSTGPGVITLRYVPSTISGFKPIETDKTSVLWPTPAVIAIDVTPEPMTLALLGLGGLIAIRRRRA